MSIPAKNEVQIRRIKETLTIAAVFVLLIRVFLKWTAHPGEAVLLVMPPLAGVILVAFWPEVRKVKKKLLILYIVVVTVMVLGAELTAAWFVGGRVIPIEVFWAVYFIVGWRLAWAIWKRTVGRIAESRRRALRLRGGSARISAWLISAGRVLLTLSIFVPLLVGSLVHRVKIGNPVSMPDYRSLDLESVSFRTHDGLTISGWFLPERGATDTVIICHGAGANKSNFIGFLTLFYGQGYNGLIFDFRGHGDSDGHTTSFGLYEERDVRAAVDWLRRDRPERCRHIVALGSSMGAMALARAAAHDPRIEVVVLDSCFVSAEKFAMDHLGRVPVVGRPVAHLMLAGMSVNLGRSMYDLDLTNIISKIAPRPIFFIHGDEDFLIRPSQMDILYDLAGAPKEKWLGHGPHSNVLAVEYEEYQRRVVGFFNHSLGKAGIGRRHSPP
jgi:pimeloyl-ACP methyl ester carboxylesterase